MQHCADIVWPTTLARERDGRQTSAVAVSVVPVSDEALVAFISDALTLAGFDLIREGSTVRVDGAGVGLGDHSVDLEVTCVAIDGIRIVRLSSLMRSSPGTFDTASLAAVRGNGACVVPKFDVVEMPEQSEDPTRVFRVRASLTLFADYLSAEEFSTMTFLYLKEVDAIDNELASIISASSPSPKPSLRA